MLATSATRPARLSETMRRVRLEKLKREEKLPGAAQPAQRALPALQRRGVGGGGVEREGRRGILGIQARIRLRSIKQWPKLPVVAMSCLAGAPPAHPTPDRGGVS